VGSEALRPATVTWASDGAAWVGVCDWFGLRPDGALLARYDGTSWVEYGAADGLRVARIIVRAAGRHVPRGLCRHGRRSLPPGWRALGARRAIGRGGLIGPTARPVSMAGGCVTPSWMRGTPRPSGIVAGRPRAGRRTSRS
jgi:hypothetical protein